MGLFRRKTAEEKAAEEQQRQLAKEAEERERQHQQQIEAQRQTIIAEQSRLQREAEDDVEDFYITNAPKWEYKLSAARGALMPAKMDITMPWTGASTSSE